MKPQKPKKSASGSPRTEEKKSVPTPEPAAKKSSLPKKKLEVPPILLEGDSPVATGPSGPGKRYALGPGTGAGPETSSAGPTELPEAYGTERLLVVARDPHWLYAHWDLTRQQLQRYNSLSADKHLVLRVYVNAVQGPPLTVVHVHPESRNWFVHVDRAGTKYVAELGYHDIGGKWVAVARSSPTMTPPDSMSEDTSVRFASIPVDIPFEQLLEAIKQVALEHRPLAEALFQLREKGHRGLPGPAQFTPGRWSPEQERALAEVVNMDEVRRVWIGSLEVTEMVRRQLSKEISSLGVSQFSAPGSPGVPSSLSSPFGGETGPKGFWFKVNAELIIYGSTEPDASVTIGGKKIKLRSDGSFSFRFSLPDGEFELPAKAVSADGDDQRAAELKFSRDTSYRGEVGQHPPDPKLKSPSPSHVA